MKRGQSGLSLVIGIDKPQVMSSHDAVNRIRRMFGERRVGHMGTLDPLATGVLAVCVGPASRLDAYLTNHDKTYEARIAFGAQTDTDDAAGEVIRQAAVAPELSDATFAQEYLASIVGPRMQMPPAYSAIKKDGVKAYEAARRGKAVELEARPVEVRAADLLAIDTDDAGRVFWDVRLEVSKGTYIRSIARDAGLELGSAAHLSALRRVRAGRLGIEACVSLEEAGRSGITAACDPVDLLGFPALEVDVRMAESIRCGRPLPLAALDPDAVHAHELGMRCIVFRDELVALYETDPFRGQAHPRCVFSQGVLRGTHR